jgi:hypothetical protein
LSLHDARCHQKFTGGVDMNSNQRSQATTSSDNGGNTMDSSSSRGPTADKDNLNKSQQSGTLNSDSMQQGGKQGSQQRQGMPQERQSNDVAGGMPKSPRGNRQSADQKMDDDTGLSNTVNREPSELDQNNRQERQSNVGRRDDGTPD